MTVTVTGPLPTWPPAGCSVLCEALCLVFFRHLVDGQSESLGLYEEALCFEGRSESLGLYKVTLLQRQFYRGLIPYGCPQNVG